MFVTSLCRIRGGFALLRPVSITSRPDRQLAAASDDFATTYHAPVMWEECIEALLGDRGDESVVIIDGTLGGGGHSQAILQKMRPGDVLVGCDVDQDALDTAAERLKEYTDYESPETPHFRPVQSNFCNLAEVFPSLEDNRLRHGNVDGILLDLGVSSHQIDTPERGFAFQQDGPLDMRMGSSVSLMAADICNQFDQAELQRIFKVYGDEQKRARSIARSIVESRPLRTTQDLAEAVKRVTPEFSKSKRDGRTKTLARIFQALRIVVNQEDVVLQKALEEMAPTLLKPGGRLVVLSYHSKEDRATKRILRDGSVTGKKRYQFDEKDIYGNFIGIRPFRPLGKARRATHEEIEMNSRARSATLRVGERL